MKDKKWLIYLPLILIPLVDQIAKKMIPFFLESKEIFFLKFQYNLNQNFILGSFESIPLFTKSVVSCSIFLVAFSLVLFIQILLVPKVTMLRLALNSYFAAMFSNCLDKILYLGVRDFITFDNHVLFNLADVFQWIALPLIVISLFYYAKEIWTPNCLRKSYFLGVQSQMKIVFAFLFIVSINLIFVLFFNYSFLTYIGLEKTELTKYLGTALIFNLALFFVSMIFTLLYSQRIVGPVISLLSFIKKNKHLDQTYKIRKGDPIVELEEIASSIRKDEDES